MNGNGAAPPAAPSEDWRNRIKKLANLGVSMSEDDDLCTFGGPTMADDKRPFPQRWGSDVWRERSVQVLSPCQHGAGSCIVTYMLKVTR